MPNFLVSGRITRAARRCTSGRSGSLFGGVPMPWMMLWAGGYPIAVAEARGSRVVCEDGVEFVDLCLGDTGAMAGHAPAPVLEALRAPRGITTMLPTEDAAWVGEELTRRFGLARWLFTLTATDANRTALRVARMLTGRPKVLVYSVLLPRLGRRGVRGDVRARDGLAGRQRRARRSTSRRRRPRSSSTIWMPWKPRCGPARSPACWPSRR